MPTRKPSKYGNSYRSAKSSFNPRRGKNVEFSSLRSSEATNQDEKLQATRLAHSIDEAMGFPRYESGKKKIGWLINMHSTTVEDDKVPGGRAGVDFYFLEDDGGSFKATVEYDPYFLIAVKRGREAEVEEWCRRMFEGQLKSVKRIEKEDLQMPNHLLGYRRTLLQLIFVNVNDLLAVRRIIMPIAEKNKKSMNAMDTYAEVARYVRLRRAPGGCADHAVSANAGFDLFDDERVNDVRNTTIADASDFIVDIREFDVPYHVRVAIDKGGRLATSRTNLC
jgi:DNA polymerase epsilon subunit 1